MKKASAPPTRKADLAAEVERLQEELRGLKAEHAKTVDALSAERDEAREQQQATGDVLSVISSSPGELQRVFATLLENATRLCGAEHAALDLYDGESFQVVAHHGLPAEYAATLVGRPIGKDPGTPLWRLAATRQTVQIADLMSEPAFRDDGSSFEQGARAKLTAFAGARSYLLVPMLKDGGLAGAIAIYRQEVRPFTDKQIELVENFAKQAVIAIENARLLTELRESLDRQTATADILRVIASTPGDSTRALNTIAETAARMFDASNVGIMRIERNMLHHVATAGRFATEVRQSFPDLPLDGTMTPVRCVLENRLIHIEDFASVAYDTAAGRLAQEMGIRTAAYVALTQDGRAIGCMAVTRTKVRPFRPDELDMMRGFADQAVIAIENARLLTELRESLDRQTAMSEVLGIISASPGDLKPVFETMLEKALSICEAQTGLVYRRDGSDFDAIAMLGVPQVAVDHQIIQRATPLPGSNWGNLIETRSTVHCLDLRDSEGYRRGDPGPRAIADLTGMRTVLYVPLNKEADLIGVLVIYRKEVRPFAEKQIELVENFAKQAVIAIENARLLTELRESLDRQTATSEVLGVISASPGELQPVFDTMVENAVRLCGAAEGTLFRVSGPMMTRVASHGLEPGLAAVTETPISPPGSPADRAFQTKATVHVADLATEMEAQERANPGHLLTALGQRAARLGVRTLICVPLLNDGKVIGLFFLNRREVRPFADKQIELVENFGKQAVIAIENARLLTELRESLDRQTATSEVLSVISSAPGELEPVFNAILDNALRICEADTGNLYRLNSGGLNLAALRGALPAYEDYLRNQGGFQVPRTGGLVRAFEQMKVVQIPDLRQMPGYLDRTSQPTVASVEIGGTRTVLYVPMVKNDEVIGVIIIYRRIVRPFTDKHVELVENFAAQAVIAIENARLLSELRESLDRQTATADILRVIASTPGDSKRALDTIAETAARMFGAASVNIRRLDGDTLRFAASFGQSAESTRAAIGDGPLDPKTISGAAMLDKRPIVINDTRAASVPVLFREQINMGPRGSRAATPLLREGHAIGALVIIRDEVRPFNTTELAQLQNFADQAVIAIENARLLTELRESLDRQTATAEVLGVISASPGTLETVFDSMLRNATRLCQASAGSLILLEPGGERVRVAAVEGMTPSFDAAHGRGYTPFNPDGPGPFPRAVRTRSTVHVADMSQDPSSGVPRVAAAVAEGVRTMCVVPMMREGEMIGAIALYRREVQPFADKQIELVENFAKQVVIAIENARLLTELRESLDRQTATSEVLGVISASPGELQPVFETMVANAVRLCEASEGSLFRVSGSVLHRVASHGLHPELAAQRELPIMPGSLMEPTLRGKKTLHTHDLLASLDEWRGEGAMWEQGRIAVERAGLRTTLWVPLVKDDAAVGIFALNRREVRPFTDKQIELVENFAKQAVIAIENARLLTELRESLNRQTATSEVLGTIASSPGDLQPVFRAIAERATRLSGADFGNIARFEDGKFVLVQGTEGTPSALSRFYAEMKPARRPVSDQDDETLVLHIPDITNHPTYLAGHPLRVALAHQGGVRTMLRVALARDDQPLGVIAVYRTRVEPFTERQIELVENFAKQAVIAIENARLLGELRESLENQTASAEILRAIASTPGDAKRVLSIIAETAQRLFDATGLIMLIENGVFCEHEVSAGGSGHRGLLGKAPDRSSVSGRAVIEKRLISIDDLHALASEYPAANFATTRTIAAAPMLRDDQALGVVVLGRREARLFTEKQIQLLQSFADQAVIAIENARLLTELHESLDRQTATSEVLSVISSSPGELQPVFDTMVENAVRLCGAVEGTMFRISGNTLFRVASHGMSAEMTARTELPIYPGSAAAAMLATKATIHLPDYVATVAEAERLHPESVAEPLRAQARIAIARGIRTVMSVPLLKDGEVIGAFFLNRRESRPFTDKQIELVENFAKQAVIAIENARLLTELRESLDRQTATADILRVIASTPGDSNRALDTIAETAARMFDALGAGYGRLEGGMLRTISTTGTGTFPNMVRDALPEMPLDPAYAAAQCVLENRQIEIDGTRAALLSQVPGMAQRPAVTTVFTPLTREGEAIGYMVLNRREVRPFRPDELELMRGFADQAVIAIENARLLTELRERTDELARRQAELRVTFDNMGDGVAMFDGETRLVSWNRNLQEILDLPDPFFVERRTFRDYITYLIERGEFGAVDLETELGRYADIGSVARRIERTRPDGRVLEIRNNPVPGGGFVTIYSDVTERKRAEERVHAARDAAEKALGDLKTAQASLVQAEKMASLGQLTAGIAHEIKNPLNFVNNFAGLSVELLDELKEAAAPAIAALGDDKRDEIDEVVQMLTSNLDKIAEHGRRADGIVKSMLAHSRGGSGERQSVDLNGLVEESLNLAYHGARAQDQNFNVTLERDLDASLAPLDVVPQDVTRVFLNLFGNGFYAANKRKKETDEPDFKPTLKVTTRDAGGDVVIRIRDNGIGILPEIRDKLFQPFFTTKPTGEGTGLGLSISYEIVTQQHGGTIEVESEPGGFTEFTVRLPRAPKH